MMKQMGMDRFRLLRHEGTEKAATVDCLLVLRQRSNKAREALNEGRIKKYIFEPSGRVVWIVVGKTAIT
jgi:hypothetical protein